MSVLGDRTVAVALAFVASYGWFGAMAFYPLGLATWGRVAAAIGVAPALWIGFGLSGAAMLAPLTVPDVRRLPAHPAAVPPSPAASPARPR